MTYSKPEIIPLGDAREAIQSSKAPIGTLESNQYHEVGSAYDPEE
jgi:hypothetical protein